MQSFYWFSIFFLYIVSLSKQSFMLRVHVLTNTKYEDTSVKQSAIQIQLYMHNTIYETALTATVLLVLEYDVQCMRKTVYELF